MDSACSVGGQKRKHETDDEIESGQKGRKEEVKSDKNEAKAEVGDKKKSAVNWTEIRAENLDCDYCRLYSEEEADGLLAECDAKLTYNTGDLTKVFIFGKWQDIPRQQVSLRCILFCVSLVMSIFGV